MGTFLPASQMGRIGEGLGDKVHKEVCNGDGDRQKVVKIPLGNWVIDFLG